MIISGAIILFVLISLGFFYYFKNSQVEHSVATIMSVISGVIIVWIILSVVGILKEFTIKGGSFEISSKLKDDINNVRQDVSETRREMIEKFADLKLSINTISSSKSESKIEQKFYNEKTNLNSIMEQSGITSKKLDTSKEIPKEEIENIDAILNRVKVLEETIGVSEQLSIKELMSRANFIFYKKNYKRAIELYSNILKKDPENRFARFNLAYSYAETNEFSKSIVEYGVILKNDPNFPEALNNIGFCYGQLNENSKAVEYFQKALSNDVNNVFALRNMGHQFRNSDPKKSLEFYERALKVDPNNIDSIQSIAVNYLFQEKFKKAKEYASKLLSLHPKNVDDEISMSIGQLIIGNYEKADYLLEDILKRVPKDPDALYNRACAKSLLGQVDSALEFLEQSIKLDPSSKEDMKRDPDLKNLRNNKKFQKLLE